MPIVTPSFVYPTSMELQAIDQDLIPVLMQTNPIFQEFPVKEADAAVLKWERRDNYLGLMQTRGLEGEYPVIPPVPISDFELTPGRYGEHALITGKEIEERRGFGTINQPIKISDLVVERQEETANRQFNFMAYLLWTLLTKGYYIQVAHNGAVVKRDAVVLQSFDSSTVSGGSGVYWTNQSASTPLGDFRRVKLFHRGHSVMFDSSATAWMNSQTLIYLLQNTNAADVFGRRSAGLETVEGLGAYNKVIATKDNLPMIREFDEGYLDSAGNFQLFIPDGVVVLIGKRTNGAALGEFTMTRNADNGNSPTPLVKVVEHGLAENQAPPAKIAVYRGFNGGPRIFYPTSIVIMKVA